jgi:hypothetical protein
LSRSRARRDLRVLGCVHPEGDRPAALDLDLPET